MPTKWTEINVDDFRKKVDDQEEDVLNYSTEDDDFEDKKPVNEDPDDELEDQVNDGVDYEEEGEDDEAPKKKKPGNSRAQERIRQLNAQKKAEQAAREKAEAELQEVKRALKAQKKEAIEAKKAKQETLKATVESQKQAYANTLAALKDQLKKAHEDGDSEAFVEIQTKLGETQLALKAFDSWKPDPVEDFEDEEEDEVLENNQKPKSVKELPQATQDWLDANPWFIDPEGKDDLNRREEAQLYNASLIRKGYDPSTPEFYAMIDKRLKKLGIAKESDDDLESDEDEDSSTSKDVKKTATRKPQTVRGQDRSSPRKSSPNKIVLTPEEKQMADLLGVSHEAYAKELLKLKKAEESGSTYVRI